MINYEIYYYNTHGNSATMGTYSSKELAESVCKTVNDFNGEEYAYIREVEVFTEIPTIYTHCSYIIFEEGDINNIHSYKLDQATIFDIPKYSTKNHLSKPPIQVIALGINELDSISKVKMKMVQAIQLGLYQSWKDSFN